MATSDGESAEGSVLPAHAENAIGGLFYDDDQGCPVKFHIQKYLGPIAEELKKMIVENGGQVISSVPINGYVLLDPTSDKGKRLKQKWDDPSKPDRHIVCYTWVPASIAFGEWIPMQEMKDAIPLFVQNERPVEIFLHKSLGHARRQTLIKKTTKFGGVIAPTLPSAGVIIADDTQEIFNTLLKRYDHSNDVYVEPSEWVQACINHRKYTHEPIEPKVVGGRPIGSTRKEYSDEDDLYLAEYLGKRLPRSDMPGRTGNHVYKELCERVDLYPWASRHTWQSWRNRYKKQRERIDQLIDEYVRENPQPIDGKGQYLVVRTKAEANEFRRRKVAAMANDSRNTTSLIEEEVRSGGEEGSRPTNRHRPETETDAGVDGQPLGELDAESIMRTYLSK